MRAPAPARPQRPALYEHHVACPTCPLIYTQLDVDAGGGLHRVALRSGGQLNGHFRATQIEELLSGKPNVDYIDPSEASMDVRAAVWVDLKAGW